MIVIELLFYIILNNHLEMNTYKIISKVIIKKLILLIIKIRNKILILFQKKEGENPIKL